MSWNAYNMRDTLAHVGGDGGLMFRPMRTASRPSCLQCGRRLNPVSVLLSPVCGRCCRRNHAEAIGGDAETLT